MTEFPIFLRANVKATQIKATVSISKRQNRFL